MIGGKLFLILLHDLDHPSRQTHHLISHDISHQISQYNIHQPNLLSIHGDGPDEDAQSQQSSELTLGAGAMGHGDEQSPRQPPRQSPKPHSRKEQRQDTGLWT